MEQELQSLVREAKTRLEQVSEATQLEEFRVCYLGRKGRFSTIMRRLGTVPAEERPRVGQLANSLKSEVEELFNQKRASLQADTAGGKAQVKPDLTLPGRCPASGRLHPVTRS